VSVFFSRGEYVMIRHMKDTKKTFVIIDGHAIIHRAYHALPPMTVKDGTIVNAVYGFTSTLLKVMEVLHPTHIAVCFDVAGGTFRDEVYTEYKATRGPVDQDLYDQIPLVYDIVHAFDIPIYFKEGFEADDVIGTLAKEIEKEKGVCTVVVTGDKDLLQLADDGQTSIFLLQKGMSDTQIYDAAGVRKRFGFAPTLIPDFKALMGDPSDNIPGVRGIGEKTATELITTIGSVEEMYRQLEDQDSAIYTLFRPAVIKKLVEGKKDAVMSLELATIVTNVPDLSFRLKDAAVHTFDYTEVKDLFFKFEFFSLIQRIPGGDGSLQSSPVVKKSDIQKKKGVLTVVDSATFALFEKKLCAATQFVCKELLQGDPLAVASFDGLLFCLEGEGFVLRKRALTSAEWNSLMAIFADEKKIMLGHDIKELVKVLGVHGVVVHNRLFDIMIASYIINSSTRAHDIESIVRRELGKELPGVGNQSSLFGTDPSILFGEVELYAALYERYETLLREDENRGLFDTVEMPLIVVLADMERHGIFVDLPLLKKLSGHVEKEISTVEKEIWKAAGKEFNVASSKQLREILFDDLALPTAGIKKGKTGYSTSASELEKLREQHDIIGSIESFRELEKLRNTYIDVLPTLVNPHTKRIHTHFNQTVATTGRLSSSNPNLQNIPIRTELGRSIRHAFIAEPGNVLIAADYSQIELRIVASLAEDQKMLEIFKQGEDIHTATAAAINGVPLEDVTKEMRRAAKEVNFGVLYGMGAYGLAWRANIPQWQAKEFIDAYFEQFSGVKKYLDATLLFAKEEGYVETLFGRRRYIPELESSNYQVRSAGERMAINMPIQGTAADLMKLAMIALQKAVGMYTACDVRMLLQVHDEVVFEVNTTLADEVAALVKETMEQVTTLRVPIDVEVGIGANWGEIK